MQLISALLFVLSVVVLAFAVLFVRRWHKGRERASVVRLLREHIEHIGISAVVEYPDTPRPLLALLDEEYPRSEAIVVTDLQHYLSSFGELIRQYNLVRVNHTHLEGVRALYRSRHRAFRRVVMIDLPTKYRSRATTIAKRVASYDYILRLEGESIVARNALSYCANIIASQCTTSDFSLESIVGANVLLERSDTQQQGRRIHLRSGRILAWQKARIMLTIATLSLPALIVLVAHIAESRLILLTALLSSGAIAAFLYISCRVVAEKSLFATFGIILHNFYRFLVEQIKKIRYLYKEQSYRIVAPVKSVKILAKRANKGRQL
jgi:hypothetical protein